MNNSTFSSFIVTSSKNYRSVTLKSIALFAITFVLLSVSNLNAQAPANDLCDDAISLDCNATVSGTTIDATFDDVGTCVTTNTAPGVWYSIEGTGGDITLSTCNQASYDTKISVFSGACDALVCINGNDDGSGCTGFSSELTFLSTLGEDYLVLVHGFNSATGTFDLTATCAPVVAVPANDLCADAIPVLLDVPVTGNTESATVDTEDFCGTSNGTGGGIWYSYTPAADGDYKITTCAAATNYDTKVRVYSGACDALVCVSGDDDESTDPLCSHSGVHSMALASLLAGEEYSILVHGFGSNEGDFELLVTLDDPCAADTEAPEVTCGEFITNFDDCPFFIFQNTPSGDWFDVPASGILNTAVGGSYISTTDFNACVSDNVSAIGDLEWFLVSSYVEDDITGCSKTIVNEIKFRDACGNESTDNVLLKSVLSEANPSSPTIICPPNLSVNCGDSTEPANTGFAVGDTDCGNATVTYEDASASSDDCPIIEVITRTWTATNGCGLTATCVQTINVEDNEAPELVPTATPVAAHDCTVYDSESLMAFAMGTMTEAEYDAYVAYVLDLYLAQLSPISNTDACDNGATIVFGDITVEYTSFLPGGTIEPVGDDCSLRARFTLEYHSEDDCGNATEPFFVSIEAFDAVAPEITEFPADITIECSELEDQSEAGVLAYLLAAYDASDVSYEDNCVPFDAIPLDIQAELGLISVEITSDFSDPCNSWCAKTLTVTDGCQEVSETFTVTIIDTEAPVFEDFESPVMVECLEDVPAILDLTAEDCGNTIEATSFSSNTGELVTSCDLSAAIGQGADWSLWLPVLAEDGMVTSASFVFDANGGTFETYADGTAHIFGTLENVGNSSETFELNLWLENQADWTTWSGLGRTYKESVDCGTPNAHMDWSYYELVGGISHAIGTGDLLGSTLSFEHMPASYYFGFQIGQNANDKNCNYGMSGWFTYTGLVGGEQVEGHGDLNVDADCEDNNEVDCANHTEFTYVYRAADVCGNAAWTTQTIIVDDVTAPTFTSFPADETISCEEWPTAVATVTAEDNCIGDVLISEMVQDSLPGDCPNSFVITRTWRITDLCENFMDSTQTITVQDIVAPVMAGLPAYELEVECDAIPEAAEVTATDNCSLPENITINFLEESTIDVDGSCDYYITRTWSAN